MAATVKKSTLLTGLPVVENGKKRLLLLYKKTLAELAKMPESASYRKQTEEVVKYRSSIVESSSLDEAEKRIGCGQFEELMIQAQNELALARKFLIWKPWESLKVQSPPNQWKWPM